MFWCLLVGVHWVGTWHNGCKQGVLRRGKLTLPLSSSRTYSGICLNLNNGGIAKSASTLMITLNVFIWLDHMAGYPLCRYDSFLGFLTMLTTQICRRVTPPRVDTVEDQDPSHVQASTTHMSTCPSPYGEIAQRARVQRLGLNCKFKFLSI